MTEPSRELIERFLMDECSAEEAEYVARCLEQDPALLDRYMSHREWADAGNWPVGNGAPEEGVGNGAPEEGVGNGAGKEGVRMPGAPEEGMRMSGALREEMRAGVYRATRPAVGRIVPVRRLWMKAIAAACFIGLVVIGYQMIPSVRQREVKAPGRGSVAVVSTALEKTVTNSGTTGMKFTTSDGSVIELAAHSEVSYAEPFTARARDFRLKGEAVFVVAKDPVRPFTVYAGGIVTTALGTSFRVRAVDSESRVSVELLTGKVSVRPEPALIKQPTMYLLPGQAMVFDKDRQSMALHLFRDRNGAASTLAKNSAVPKGTTSETNEAWTFYNQPLPEILRTLQAAFRTNITYSADLSKIRFTGTFNKDDSLSYILRTIGAISKLQVSKNDSCYRMGK